jgi:hypothetical protein
LEDIAMMAQKARIETSVSNVVAARLKPWLGPSTAPSTTMDAAAAPAHLQGDALDDLLAHYRLDDVLEQTSPKGSGGGISRLTRTCSHRA